MSDELARMHERGSSARAYLDEQSGLGRFTGSALIRSGGKVLVDTGYGDADRQRRRPNTPQTAFQICSISKQFAAAAILMLQERGALSVGNRVCTWIPNCPPAWEPVTLHHLLTHTSGIGHWFDFPELDFDRPRGREELIAIFQAQDLKFHPGTQWFYSSPGYVLLAHIVEQVSGTPYAAFLEEHIFRPLGMGSSGAGSHAPPLDRRAIGYKGDEPAEFMELDTVGIGAGDIWSTVEDMGRWNTALDAPGLLTDDSLQAMFAPHAPTTETWLGMTDLHYGYGTYVGTTEGRTIIFHPGHNSGFRSMSILLPGDEAVAVLLSNDEDADLDDLSRPILVELLH